MPDKSLLLRHFFKKRIFSFNKNIKTMGKGDKRTKRGKIILGSHGVSRPKPVKVTGAPKPAAPAEAPAE